MAVDKLREINAYDFGFENMAFDKNSNKKIFVHNIGKNTTFFIRQMNIFRILKKVNI